jgi:hypothetical protein
MNEKFGDMCPAKSLLTLLKIKYKNLANYFLQKKLDSMGSKRRRATSPSSSVSGDFDDGHHSVPTPGPSRKRRRLSNLPTVDPVSI